MKMFITRNNISTSVGYPLQITGGTRIHLRTLVIFRYRPDNELCSAAARAGRDRRQVSDTDGGPSGRRHRRTTTNVNTMSQDLVTTILADKDKLVGCYIDIVIPFSFAVSAISVAFVQLQPTSLTFCSL